LYPLPLLTLPDSFDRLTIKVINAAPTGGPDMKTAQRDIFYTERLLDGLAELCRLHEDDDTTFKIEAAKLLETLTRSAWVFGACGHHGPRRFPTSAVRALSLLNQPGVPLFLLGTDV